MSLLVHIAVRKNLVMVICLILLASCCRPEPAQHKPITELIREIPEPAQHKPITELIRKVAEREKIYAYLSSKLNKGSTYVRSARAELEYCKNWGWLGSGWIGSASKKDVGTKDGKKAEVVLLDAPSLSIPGTDFSMAFLIVEGRVIDWKSCLTYNRAGRQKIQLEDVDGDGYVDLSFRYAGMWGWLDERKHTLPNDDRKWLYAYSIESKGFKSIFPETDRTFPLEVAVNETPRGIGVSVESAPKEIKEYKMFEVVISLSNNTGKPLRIKPRGWFKFDGCGSGIGYGRGTGSTPPKEIIAPGEKIIHTVRNFYMKEVKDNQARLTLSYVPKRN